MSRRQIIIDDQRTGVKDRRQSTVPVEHDRRALAIADRRKGEEIPHVAPEETLQLKPAVDGVPLIDAATIDTPLSIEEEAFLKKLNERRAFQMQGQRTGTQRHEAAVAAGTELAFHQMPQGGYPTSQKNLYS